MTIIHQIWSYYFTFYILSNPCNQVLHSAQMSGSSSMTTDDFSLWPPTANFCCRLALCSTVQPTASREAGYRRPPPMDEPPARCSFINNIFSGHVVPRAQHSRGLDPQGQGFKDMG